MIISRSPFRISFFGGGTDYPAWFKSHPGAVLSSSIDKYCYLTCRYLPPFFEHRSRILYSKIELVKSNQEIEHPVVRSALDYLRIERGVEIHHDSDLPARTGIGSSSTFAVGLLNALYGLKQQMITKLQLAQDAITIEQKRLNEVVGCQDQVVSAFGGLNRIDFHPNETFTVSPIILSQARLDEFGQYLLLFFTGFTRIASVVAREVVENTDRKSRLFGRMYDMVGEGVSLLTAGGALNPFGELLNEGWMLKRELSDKISTPVIDEMYDQARSAGAIGGKLLGAGGGGFMLVFARPADHPSIIRRLHKLLHVPLSLEHSGSQIIFYQPDDTRERV